MGRGKSIAAFEVELDERIEEFNFMRLEISGWGAESMTWKVFSSLRTPKRACSTDVQQCV